MAGSAWHVERQMTFTRAALDEIRHHRVTPPARNGGKTLCPKCSHTRAKSDEPCLRVKEFAGRVKFRCYHCLWLHREILSNDSFAIDAGWNGGYDHQRG